MDPLTKNLLSRIGRTPGLPKLPPVNNVRLLNLQKGLQPAELALHNARIALDNFQKAPSANLTVQQARTNLHLAMEELEGREQDYFANTFTGTDKRQVLSGWKRWKQTQLRLQINNLRQQAVAHAGAAVQHNLAQVSRDSADASVRAHDELRRANQMWYTNGGFVREPTRPAGVIEKGDAIRASLSLIRENLRRYQSLPVTPNHPHNIASIQTSLTNTQRCERIFKAVVAGEWVSTDETRVP